MIDRRDWCRAGVWQNGRVISIDMPLLRSGESGIGGDFYRAREPRPYGWEHGIGSDFYQDVLWEFYRKIYYRTRYSLV